MALTNLCNFLFLIIIQDETATKDYLPNYLGYGWTMKLLFWTFHCNQSYVIYIHGNQSNPLTEHMAKFSSSSGMIWSLTRLRFGYRMMFWSIRRLCFGYGMNGNRRLLDFWFQWDRTKTAWLLPTFLGGIKVHQSIINCGTLRSFNKPLNFGYRVSEYFILSFPPLPSTFSTPILDL